MDHSIDRPLPPGGIALAVGLEPAVIGRPMARLITFNDPENLHQATIGLHERVGKQDLDLAVTAPNVSGDAGSEDPEVTSGQRN